MLPTDPKERKAIPVSSGCFAYFADALIAVAQLSAIANAQHNPGQPLHWAKEKSTDEADALARHQLQHVKGELYDTDRVLHATKVAWRALAQLDRLLASGVSPLAPTKTATEIANKLFNEIGLTRADELRVCNECNYVVPGHYPNCSHNFQKRAPTICFDCGVDLEEQAHALTCLRLNQPMR